MFIMYSSLAWIGPFSYQIQLVMCTFVCDFVATMKICQGELYALYYDPIIAFNSLVFHQFNALMDVWHESIIMKWITNLATSIEHLFLSIKPNTFGPNTKMWILR
jgi:hypothetical protein